MEGGCWLNMFKLMSKRHEYPCQGFRPLFVINRFLVGAHQPVICQSLSRICGSSRVHFRHVEDSWRNLWVRCTLPPAS